MSEKCDIGIFTPRRTEKVAFGSIIFFSRIIEFENFISSELSRIRELKPNTRGEKILEFSPFLTRYNIIGFIMFLYPFYPCYPCSNLTTYFGRVAGF